MSSQESTLNSLAPFANHIHYVPRHLSDSTHRNKIRVLKLWQWERFVPLVSPRMIMISVVTPCNILGHWYHSCPRLSRLSRLAHLSRLSHSIMISKRDSVAVGCSVTFALEGTRCVTESIGFSLLLPAGWQVNHDCFNTLGAFQKICSRWYHSYTQMTSQPTRTSGSIQVPRSMAWMSQAFDPFVCCVELRRGCVIGQRRLCGRISSTGTR